MWCRSIAHQIQRITPAAAAKDTGLAKLQAAFQQHPFMESATATVDPNTLGRFMGALQQERPDGKDVPRHTPLRHTLRSLKVGVVCPPHLTLVLAWSGSICNGCLHTA